MNTFNKVKTIVLVLCLALATNAFAARWSSTFYDVPQSAVNTFKQIVKSCNVGDESIAFKCIEAKVKNQLPMNKAYTIHMLAVYTYDVKLYNKSRAWLNKVLNHPQATARQKADARKKLEILQ